MKKIFIAFLLLTASFILNAQQLLQQDLRQIDVDKLSDAEISYYYNRLQQAGISFEQAAQIAASRGMSQDQLDKLEQRIQQIQSGQKSTNSPSSNSGNYKSDTVSTLRNENLSRLLLQEEKVDTRIFGSELFSSSSLSFEPNLRIATPANYVLGPDDELNIDVFGMSESHYKLKVNPEGNIYIPNVGPIFVSGLSTQEASGKITNKLASTIYRAINTGGTKVTVNLGNIRSIRVTIIGQAKKPGTYTLSSLSTIFNALYLCGGPNDKGSYRTIELVRNNRTTKVIDLYNFLLRGSMQDNMQLMDQDVIRIPYYQNRIILDGEVKRPGIFEIINGETLQNSLDAAGNFTDSAYKASVKITQFTDKERKVLDISSNQYNRYQPIAGDSVHVGKVSNRYTNRVKINGAVMRPGEFALTDGMTLNDLILKADGVKEDAFLSRGIITRLKDDLTVESVSFDVAAVLNTTSSDILLKKEDVVTISSIFDLKEKYTINIQGEVRKPGILDFKDSTSLKDLIFEAGGFTEAGTAKRIEIARRVNNADPNSSSTEIAKIIQVDAEKDLEISGSNYYLQPYDVVIVRNNPGYYTQRTVYVSGEVLYPGTYVINSNDEKLSSIINRAGGFKNTADASSASLKRLNQVDALTEIKSKKVAKLAGSESNRDTAAVDSLTKEAIKPYDLIGINLEEVMKAPGITNDLIVESGDLIFVPKKNQAVKVRGEVLFPTQFAFEEGRKMNYFLNKAGGYTSNAVIKKSFVLSANGNARKVKSFLFFRSYPDIKAGDEIFVPRKPDNSYKRLSTAEAIGITSAVASLAGVVIAIIQITK